jgi:putative nucleotidyltransferase with HDIG domain
MISKINRDDLLISVSKLPVLSKVVSHAIKIISDPNCSIRELVDVISKDQSISAKVVKLANSAFYGTPRRITSLSEALVRLGLKTTNSLLITASVSNLFKNMANSNILNQRQLWSHSYAVAFTSGSIAKASRRADRDLAFTSGILHDIGKLILANYLKSSYEEVFKLALNSNAELWDVEEKTLGFSHATVGGLVLDHWSFPEAIITSIANHHKVISESEFDPLVGILQLSDGLVIEKGIGISSGPPRLEAFELIQNKLGLSDEMLLGISDLLDSELGTMSEFFGSDEFGMSLAILPDSMKNG